MDEVVSETLFLYLSFQRFKLLVERRKKNIKNQKQNNKNNVREKKRKWWEGGSYISKKTNQNWYIPVVIVINRSTVVLNVESGFLHTCCLSPSFFPSFTFISILRIETLLSIKSNRELASYSRSVPHRFDLNWCREGDQDM